MGQRCGSILFAGGRFQGVCQRSFFSWLKTAKPPATMKPTALLSSSDAVYLGIR
jgi:hypothetical protein